MSYTKIRRCHITCRVDSLQAMNDIVKHDKIITANDKEYAIHRLVAAYSSHTKEARVYAEFDRTHEKIVEEHMHNMGAGSVIIDSFPREDWENASEIALNSVLECGSRPGFLLIRQENETSNGNIREEEGIDAGGRNSSDDDLPEGPAHSSSKRKRNASSTPPQASAGQSASSPYGIPESIPAYMLQFTSQVISSSLSDSFSRTMGSRAEEAGTKLCKAQVKIQQQQTRIDDLLTQLETQRRIAQDAIAARERPEAAGMAEGNAALAQTRAQLEDAMRLSENNIARIATLEQDLQAEKAKTADALSQLEDQRRIADEETLQRKALEEELAKEKSQAAAALTAIEQTKAREIEELRQRTTADHEQTRLLLKTAQTDIAKLQASKIPFHPHHTHTS